MKSAFRSRVVHDPIHCHFVVEYRKWWSPFWKHYQTFRYDSDKTVSHFYQTKDSAQNLAQKRADSIVESQVVYRR